MKKIFCLFIILNFPVFIHAQNSLFTETMPMNEGRQMHGAVVLGDYFYVLGGERKSDKDTNTVEYAKINPDGSLNKFSYTSPLPKKISYIDNCTISYNDIVYIASGWDTAAKKSLNTILWSKPLPNGQLSQWAESKPYNGPGVNCAAAVATQGYIHIIGGLGANDKPTNAVWSAKIAQDGSIAGWEQSTPLPEPIWYHCAAVSGGKVWIWGGLLVNDNKAVAQNSYYAPILSNGKIGPWIKTNKQLPKKFYGASRAVSGPYLMAFSARYSGKQISDDIWYTQLNADGISEWTQMTKLNIKSKIYMALSADYRRNIVYICGGRESAVNQNQFTHNVYFIRLSQNEQSSAQYDAAATYSQPSQASSVSSYSYVTQGQQNKSAFNGFVSYNQAQQILSTQKKPLMVYFYIYHHSRWCASGDLL